jgi:hypothetical protein
MNAPRLLRSGANWIRATGAIRSGNLRNRYFESADSITQNGHLRHAANTAIPPEPALNPAH